MSIYLSIYLSISYLPYALFFPSQRLNRNVRASTHIQTQTVIRSTVHDLTAEQQHTHRNLNKVRNVVKTLALEVKFAAQIAEVNAVI